MRYGLVNLPIINMVPKKCYDNFFSERFVIILQGSVNLHLQPQRLFLTMI